MSTKDQLQKELSQLKRALEETNFGTAYCIVYSDYPTTSSLKSLIIQTMVHDLDELEEHKNTLKEIVAFRDKQLAM